MLKSAPQYSLSAHSEREFLRCTGVKRCMLGTCLLASHQVYYSLVMSFRSISWDICLGLPRLKYPHKKRKKSPPYSAPPCWHHFMTENLLAHTVLCMRIGATFFCVCFFKHYVICLYGLISSCCRALVCLPKTPLSCGSNPLKMGAH